MRHCPMKRIFKCMLCFWIGSAIVIVAGSDVRVAEDQVILKSNRCNVGVELTLNDKRECQIAVEIDGAIITVPNAELDGIGPIDLRSISLNTHTNDGGPVPKDLPKKHLIVGMRYGGTVEHGERDSPEVVRAYLLLYFRGGKYEGWRSAEPQEDFENAWIIRDKEVGQEVQLGDKIEMIECPIVPQGAE